MNKSLGLLLPVLFFIGCSREPGMAAESPRAEDLAQSRAAHKPLRSSGRLLGSWVEPIPGMLGGQQGFVLHADGSAASINMATLLYTRWNADAGVLRLAGQSIGNGVSSTFEDTYRIVSVDQRNLVLLTESGQRWTLSRSSTQ